jgi:hypothetical protein
MTINAGVWIDHHKAVIVVLTDEGQEMVQILAADGVSMRSAAGLRPKSAHAQSSYMADEGRGQQVAVHGDEYYNAVIACVRSTQAILILGPGEAKGELRKRLACQKFQGHVAEMKTVAQLADQQINDYVHQHYQ